jgi:hypothetical protein
MNKPSQRFSFVALYRRKMLKARLNGSFRGSNGKYTKTEMRNKLRLESNTYLHTQKLRNNKNIVD